MKYILLTRFLNLIVFMLLANSILAVEPIPLLNPLSMDQRKAAMIAAPSGQDDALESVAVMQTIQAKTLIPASEIEKNITKERQIVSLEEKIQKQNIQTDLEQFGYDLFSMVPSTYVPVTNIPVPDDYILGPGDTLIVQLFGKSNVEYKLVVTREGKVLLPEIGPVQVSGQKFSRVREQLKSQFESQVFGVKAAVTMGDIRTIKVLVVGDVVRPGSYILGGLTSLMNALLNSGGVKRTGSLRNIQVKRNGRVVSRFDIYKVLLQGDTGSDIRLVNGDVIFVPPIGATVGIGGEVLRPAIYELKNEKKLGDIIDMAGGLLASASIQSSHIDRIEKGKYHTLVDLPSSYSDAKKTDVKDGDIVRILPVQQLVDDVVVLSGHVLRPGGYQLKSNMRVSDLIPSVVNLQPNADTEFALLRRELRKNRKIAVNYLNLKEILNNPGSKFDLKLNSRDEIIIFNLANNRVNSLQNIVKSLKNQSTLAYPPMVFSIDGHVKYKGIFPLQYAARLLDVLKIAGNFKPGTDMDYALIARKTYPDNKLEMFSVSLNKALLNPGTEQNPIIHPEDKVYLFRDNGKRSELIADQIKRLKKETPYGQEAPIISITGSINQKGNYPLEPGMRISRLLQAAGGLKENSYGLKAQLTRYQLIAGEYHIAEHQSIDLKAILNGQRGANMILKPHDHITILTKPQWQDKRTITIDGEIKYPGSYVISHRETLCNVIQRAGGLTETAYPFGAIFLRESVRKGQQQSLDRIQNNLDDLLVKLHLSPSARNNEKMPAGEQKHQIDKVIRKLQKVKASGRMVVDLDKIQQCDEQADLLLENGDKLFIPRLKYQVSVMGEVYHPNSHSYDGSKGSSDYIDLSGGMTLLAKKSHAYVVQANGAVHSVRTNSWFDTARNIPVKPGATVYVPLNVDRINQLETAQSWSEIVFHLALSAASVGVMVGL